MKDRIKELESALQEVIDHGPFRTDDHHGSDYCTFCLKEEGHEDGCTWVMINKISGIKPA